MELTQVRLIELGFEPFEKGDADFWSRDNVEIMEHNDGWCVPETAFELETVEDLKNYYFSITGKEIIL